MSYRTEHHQAIPGVYGTGVDLSLTTQRRESDYSAFNGTATLVVRAGAFSVQTYLTSDELRLLAHACMRAAIDLDQIAVASLPVPEVSEAA